MHIKKFVSFLLAVSFAASPVFAFADTTATTSTNAQVQAMLQQIQTLQAQIKAMQSLQAQIASTSASISSTLGLIRNLRQGMSGDDVKALQAVLASDPTVYSGPVTGFFGALTAEAVKKFQKKNGLEAVGYIGPKTLKKLNEEFEKHGISLQVSSTTAGIAVGEPNPSGTCINIAPGHLIAPGFLKKEVENKGKKEGKDRDDDRNVMFYVSTTTASTTTTILPLCKPLPPGIEKKLGDDWKKPTTTPPVATTTPDVIAPVISGLVATGTTASTTSISWATNEAADGKIWFGTSSPVTVSTTTGTVVGGFGTTHTANISNLASSTTYYFVVGSKDAAGNLATSSQSSFTTLAQ